MIIVYNQYTADAERTVARLVACEECDAEYVYELTRYAQGMSNSIYMLDNAGAKRRAERKAQDQLERKMKTACEPIPCPKCGHVQDHMHNRARSLAAQKWWLMAAGTGFVALGGIFVAAWTSATTLGLVLAVLFAVPTAVLCVIALVVNSSHDPNKVPEDRRMQVAAEKAVTRKLFEKGFAEHEADEFEKFVRKIAKKKTRTFKVMMWADRRQVRDEARLSVRLPDGKSASVRLKPEAKDGDEYRVPGEADGHEIDFVCVLSVYTKAKGS